MTAVRVAVIVIRVGGCGITLEIIAALVVAIVAAIAILEHKRFLDERVSLERVELEFNVYVWRVII